MLAGGGPALFSLVVLMARVFSSSSAPVVLFLVFTCLPLSDSVTAVSKYYSWVTSFASLALSSSA